MVPMKCMPVVSEDYGLTPIGRRAHEKPVRIVAPTRHEVYLRISCS